jgi:hypothetical protein
MTATAGDLEVLPVTPVTPVSLRPAPTPPGQHSRRRRWPVVTLVAVLVGFVLGVPIRSEIAKREFRWLAGRIAQYQALEQARQEAIQTIDNAAFPGDEARAADAVFALSLEEASHLHQLDHSVAGALLVDGKLAQLRRAFRQLLNARQLNLRSSPALAPPVDASQQRVDELLASQHRRFGGSHPRPTAAVHLHAADSTLAALHHWLDQPTGAHLLALGVDGVLRLDVDASQARRLTDSAVLDGELIPRLGYVGLISNGKVLAEPIDLQGPPRVIGHGVQAFAADRPDAIWVITIDDTIGEIDGAGRQLVPPAAYQGFVSSTSVARGVVVHTQRDGLIVWDPASGRTACQLGMDGEPIAGSGDLLAWVDLQAGLHLTDVSACRTRAVDRPDPPTYRGFLGAAGALSPDGRTAACYVALRTGGQRQAFRLALIDVASGRVTIPQAPHGSSTVEPIAWTSDSQRLFFTLSTPGGAAIPATYRLGQTALTPLRYRAVPGFSVLAVLPPAG